MADNQENIMSIRLDFSDSKIPEFKKVNNKEWVPFGSEDLGEYSDKYPDYLLYLFNKSAKHNAIINGKLNYIFGGGLKSEDPAIQNWLLKFNGAGESGNDVSEKSLRDLLVHGGFYWQIIYNNAGAIQDKFHLEFRNVRSNIDNTEFFYKRNWADRKEEVKKFPAFNPDAKTKETSIFFFSEYRPGVKTYCLPDYVGSINYIEADIEVSKHTLTNAKAGFAGTKFLNFYNGEPEEDKKRAIERRFNDKHTGAEGKRVIIAFSNDPTKKPTIDDLGASDLTKEDFTHTDNLIAQNIYAGHQITSPMLFGIQEPGKLGGHNELRIAYEIFKNTYARKKQQQFERILNAFAQIESITGTVKFIQTDPVGIEFSDQVILSAAPASWVLEKMGIDSSKYKDAPIGYKNPNPQALPAVDQTTGQNQAAVPVNDNIKNLSAKQHQQLLRIIRQYSKGQLTQAAATTMLKASLGLNDEEIKSLLGVNDDAQFGKQFSEEDVADMFSECGTTKENFELLQSKKVHFQSDSDAVHFELNFLHQLQFDTDSSGNEVPDKSILDEIRKKITDTKKITRKLPQIKVMYSYEVQADQGAAVIATTRAFCRKMISLDRLYTRQEIESISQRLGYSVWDRRGGFWNNNGTVEKHCRHLWKSNIVVKKNNS
jgi:hypothetical protein